MKRILLVFMLIWATLNGIAQVSFVAKAPQQVDVNGQFSVKFVLTNADGENFSAPSFGDFEVLAGPSQSSYTSMQIVNGHSSHTSSVTYTYILQPKKKGTFHIAAASVKAGGKTLHTKPLTISVGGDGSAAKSNSRPQSADDEDFYVQPQRAGSAVTQKDLFFTVGASKRQVYEQEPIMLTYKFHSKIGVGLANVMLRQKPDLKGFWTQEIELPRNLSPTTERINGNLYRVGTNLQYVIFPQQTGKLTIPGITFDCDVMQRDQSIDALDAFFNGGGNIKVKLQRTTDDLTIDVLPLPQPKPTAFSGGVGQFKVHTQLVTPNPKTNDIGTLRITVSGSGNMKLIKAPTISFPKDFDTYEAKMNDKTKVSIDGITGEVYFDYTFVPRNVGEYEIPAADFVYFDTAKREYVTLHTDPIHLNVKKGNRSKEDIEAEMALRNADIHDLHTSAGGIFTVAGLEGSARPHKSSFFGASVCWLGSFGYLLLLVFSIVGLSALLRYLQRHVERTADVTGNRNRKARKKANKHLRNAEKALATNDHNAFYSAMAQALRGYFADKLSADVAALTNETILTALAARGLDAESFEATRRLLEDCDFARFSPAQDSSQREHDLERASDLINHLEVKLH